MYAPRTLVYLLALFDNVTCMPVDETISQIRLPAVFVIPAQAGIQKLAGQRQLFWPLYANYFGRFGSVVIVVCNCRSCASPVL